MFVDRIKVFAQAGKGGRGSVSFRREKLVPKGGPDGGDGGRGGDVLLRADRHVDNLTNLFYEPIIKAKSGGHGMGKKMYGRAAPAKIVKVPVGTIVYQLQEDAERGKRPTPNVQRPTSNAEETGANPNLSALNSVKERGSHGALRSQLSTSDLLVDLVEEGQEFVLCAG